MLARCNRISRQHDMITLPLRNQRFCQENLVIWTPTNANKYGVCVIRVFQWHEVGAYDSEVVAIDSKGESCIDRSID